MLNQLTTHVLAAVPDPKPNAPADLENKVNIILGIVMWGVIAACVLGLFIVAGRMALAFRRGELGESFGGLGGVAAACLLVGAGSGVVQFLV